MNGTISLCLGHAKLGGTLGKTALVVVVFGGGGWWWLWRQWWVCVFMFYLNEIHFLALQTSFYVAVTCLLQCLWEHTSLSLRKLFYGSSPCSLYLLLLQPGLGSTPT